MSSAGGVREVGEREMIAGAKVRHDEASEAEARVRVHARLGWGGDTAGGEAGAACLAGPGRYGVPRVRS